MTSDTLPSHQADHSQVMLQPALPEAPERALARPEVLPQSIPTPAARTSPVSGLNENEGVSQDVYKVLRDHQQGASEKLQLLHSYLQPIIKRFFGELPPIALSWGPSHWGNLGWYLEKDGLQLAHRINLNSDHADRPLAEILRTLTHELGHCWQEVYGKPPKAGRDNYHNSEFRRKMQEIGILCNKRGVSLGIAEPFVGFLKELGVEADACPFKQDSQIPADGSAGSDSRPGSRLKPWACSCTRVWASAGRRLDATCNKCGSTFSEAAVTTRR
jgi:hypothetical protein